MSDSASADARIKAAKAELLERQLAAADEAGDSFLYVTSQADLGKFFKVHRNTIGAWAKDADAPDKTELGYFVPDWIEWRISLLEEDDDSPDDELRSQKLSVEIDYKQAKAEQLRFKHDVERGKYWSKQEVEERELKQIRVVRGGLLALASRCAARWAAITDSRELHTEIEREMMSILNEFSRIGRDDDA